jgi:hypothetical protein
MLFRSLSAVSQSLASKPMVAVESLGAELGLVRAIYPVIFKRLSGEQHARKSASLSRAAGQSCRFGR